MELPLFSVIPLNYFFFIFLETGEENQTEVVSVIDKKEVNRAGYITCRAQCKEKGQ